MSDLEELGRRVAVVQDRRVAALRAAEKAREAFLGGKTFDRARSRWGISPVAALAAAALAGAAATFVVLRTREHTIAFSVGDEPFASDAGRQVTTPADHAIVVHFSEGSETQIEAGSSLVIRSIDHAGAALDLERGRALVHVVHRTNTHWALHAGPYLVDVVGTRFALEWKPETSRLVVRLEEGRVVVSGGRLATPMQVDTGQMLVASADTWQLAPAASAMAAATAEPHAAMDEGAQAPTHAEPQPAESADRDEAPVDRGSIAPSPSEARVAPDRPTPPRWQQLAEAGKYEDAIAAVERGGFEATCRSASVSDLMTLAEAARLGKHPSRARQALLALRERFPGGAQASTAAFYLGRMSGDREAVTWFRTYLSEAPGGALRREASGRLLEALSRSGDEKAAADAARAYLKQYPHGPHASLAERLVRP